MRRVADHRLVKVAYLDLDLALSIGYRAEIAVVAVATDPHRGPLRKRVASPSRQPVIELYRAASHIPVRAFRHLAAALFFQHLRASGKVHRCVWRLLLILSALLLIFRHEVRAYTRFAHEPSR